MATNEKAADVGGLEEMSLLEKILAVTDGSVTHILEAATGSTVKIKTIVQEIVESGDLDDDVAKNLGVEAGQKVNYRAVEITDDASRTLMTAESWTPLNLLEERFKEDLIRADVPIGKLLLKHKIESRRELIESRKADNRLERRYRIVRGGVALMYIKETFFDLYKFS